MIPQSFKTTVQKAGSRVFIAIPFDPNEVWGKKARHHITGTVNGCAIRGSLGTDGQQFFFPLNAAWRRDTYMDASVPVEVTLAPEGAQKETLASDISTALDAEPEALIFFEALASFYRNTYIKWIESAKRPETRSARIAEMIALLKMGRKQK